MSKNLGSDYNNESDLQNLTDRITNAFEIILRPVTMEDQFKTRMGLILKDKINSEDVAKLTTVESKSHYDVLRERFFFQYIIDWFYDIYTSNKLEKS